MRKGFGVKPAVIWVVISVPVILWWAAVPRIFVINTPPVLTVIGYMYLLSTFFSFMLLLIIDIIGIVLCCLRKIKINAKYELLFVFIVVFVVFSNGYFEAKSIKTIEITVQTEKLPIDTDTIRIVQTSDLHIGKIYNPKQSANTMKITNEASPDLIVLTGDTVDIDLREDEYFVKILGDVETPLRKYAVTGNHEHYAGFEQAVDFINRAGCLVLHSDSILQRWQ
jgi:hypothetical protein